jgi:uncharacterized membrane protein YGL010W
MPRPVRTASALLQRYAESHRDRRNIATHLVGVPLMVFGAGVLLARPVLQVGTASLTPAWLAFPLAAAWYLTRGHFGLGLAVSFSVALLLALAQPLGAGGTAAWLAWGLGALATGWAVKLLGHYYEGQRAPRDGGVAAMLVAPMFVVLEVLSGVGLFRRLAADIERHAGPTCVRDLAHPLPH